MTAVPSPPRRPDPSPFRYVPGFAIAGVVVVMLLIGRDVIPRDLTVPAMIGSGAIAGFLRWLVTRPKPHDARWVAEHKRKTATKQAAIDAVAVRQSEREADPRKRLDDPLGPEEHRDMLRRSFRRSLLNMAPALLLAALVCLAAAKRPSLGEMLVIALFMAIPWGMILAAQRDRERARRYLRGDDRIYWKSMSEPRSEDDERPKAKWFEIADDHTARRDARPLAFYAIIAFSYVMIIFDIVMLGVTTKP